MKNIFSKRLKSARIRAALSQDQLVEKIGGAVTKNAISKYEKGEMMADSTILLKLAKALDVKPDYFFDLLPLKLKTWSSAKKASCW